jgi:hypothetical protein
MSGLGVAITAGAATSEQTPQWPTDYPPARVGSGWQIRPVNGGSGIQPVGPVYSGTGWWGRPQGPQPPSPYATGPGQYYPGTPVPVGTPTTSPYVDASGNLWTYSANGGGWINSNAAPGYYSGSSVPLSTPTNTTYTDPNGNVWAMIGGQWVNTTAAGAAIPANAAPTSISVSTAPATSSATDILTWLQGSTLISGVPNWVIAAGAGLLALKLSKGR